MSFLTRHHSSCALNVSMVVTIFVSSFGWLELGGIAKSRGNIDEAPQTLGEIRGSQRFALLVKRSSVINAADSDDPIIAEALAAEPREASRHRHAYGSIAHKLNQYIRKYRSLQPVYDIGQADFIIYFKLVEYRRLLNGFYPYGELFVIVNARPAEGRPARVIWKTNKVSYADDAVKDFLKELKRVRGER